MSNVDKYKPEKLIALELLATNPSMSQSQIARHLDIEPRTVRYWLSDPLFVDEFYKRYMEVAGLELPSVIAAMFEEAKMGNVQAGRLLLEHFGKLENRIKIQVESPFEKFMKIDADEAEFVDMDDETKQVLDHVASAMEVSDIELPKRNPINDKPKKREIEEKKRLDNLGFKSIKKKVEDKKQQSRYLVRKRASAVGLDLLPPGRHSKGTRDEWMAKLEELEKSNS